MTWLRRLFCRHRWRLTGKPTRFSSPFNDAWAMKRYYLHCARCGASKVKERRK